MHVLPHGLQSLYVGTVENSTLSQFIRTRALDVFSELLKKLRAPPTAGKLTVDDDLLLKEGAVPLSQKENVDLALASARSRSRVARENLEEARKGAGTMSRLTPCFSQRSRSAETVASV